MERKKGREGKAVQVGGSKVSEEKNGKGEVKEREGNAEKESGIERDSRVTDIEMNTNEERRKK